MKQESSSTGLPPLGTEGTFTLPRFTFESGERLDQLRVGFVAHGHLNRARDNAILLLPGTSNTRHSANGHIGPGHAFDTDRYFIIATDAIGAGTSSSPADGLRGTFPRYTVRDMVRATHALVTQHFGITRLHAVAGASMGAFQSLEWCILYPDMMSAAVLLVPAWRSTPLFRMTVRAAIDAIQLDPHWRNGQYEQSPVDGLRLAGRIYYPWTVTDAWIGSQPPDVVETEAAQTADRAAQWDAWSWIRRYEASAAHDVAAPFGGDLHAALTNVSARTLVLPSATDRLLDTAQAREIAERIRGARYAEIPGDRGHLGWRPVTGSIETAFVARTVDAFLREAR